MPILSDYPPRVQSAEAMERWKGALEAERNIHSEVLARTIRGAIPSCIRSPPLLEQLPFLEVKLLVINWK